MSIPAVKVGFLAAKVAKYGLGRVIVAGFVGLCFLAILCGLVYAQFGAKFWAWRAEHWRDKAVEYAEQAKVEAANARSANAGAVNATVTRENIDAGTLTIKVETEQSAERIEQHAQPDTADDPADADILQELDAAESRVRAAQDRLQRTSTGRKPAKEASK